MSIRVLPFAAAALALVFAAGAARADGPLEEGEKVFKRVCAACHIATKDGAKRLGPTLFGVVGRHSGTVDGFRYSEANKKANVDWTPAILDKYLVDPRATIPGTTMAYAGLKKDEDRKHLIEYLKTLK